MDFPIITRSQVLLKLMKLKRTSIAPFDIPVDLNKAFSDASLTFIFNKITMSGQYPQNWEKVFITPIFKKGAPCNFTSVRRVAMTPIFSKIYKSFIAGCPKTCNLHKIDPQRFGNIPKYSASHYLVSFRDKILKHLDEPEHWVNLIAIDLKKAFDLICHRTVIRKLLTNFNVDL